MGSGGRRGDGSSPAVPGVDRVSFAGQKRLGAGWGPQSFFLATFPWRYRAGELRLGLPSSRQPLQPRAPWAAEQMPLQCDGRAVGLGTSQRWHQRNLIAGCEGQVREILQAARLPWLPGPSPAPQPSAFPHTMSSLPPRMAGRCQAPGEAQPSDGGCAQRLCSPCPAVSCSAMAFGPVSVVMGGCSEELVVMSPTCVASSQAPFLSRVLDLPRPGVSSRDGRLP